MFLCSLNVSKLIFFSHIQVQSSNFKHQSDPGHLSAAVTGPSSAPSTFTRSGTGQRNRRQHHRATSRLRVQRNHSLTCEEPEEKEQWADQYHPDGCRNQWRGHRSGSLFSLPNLGTACSRSTCSSPAPPASPHRRSHPLNRSVSLVPPFRLNVDALVGAEETNVDTGTKVTPGGSVDLSVVSAYIKPSLPQTSRPLSAPPEDMGSSHSPGFPENPYQAATLGRTPGSPTSNAPRACLLSFQVRSGSVTTSAAASLSDVSISQSDTCSVVSAAVEEADKLEEEDEDQEFYI